MSEQQIYERIRLAMNEALEIDKRRATFAND
jgi:hypothetical protein